MNKLAKASSLALLLLLMATSVNMVESVSAQSIPKPSIPEFSVKVTDDSYVIPFKNVTTTDPYTGKVTWLIEGGGHMENQKVVVTIKNPSLKPIKTHDGNMTALFYSVQA